MVVLTEFPPRNNDKTKHFPPISDLDLEKLQEPNAFDLSKPSELQEKVFFDLQFGFAKRGREHVRDLKKSSFVFGRDDTGLEYIEINCNEHSKNYQKSQGPQSRPRILETRTETCPINSFKMYLSKLDPGQEALYVKPITSKKFNPATEKIWYTKKVIGFNLLGNFMKKISTRLQLSKKYTNHSIRATVVTLLTANGIEARQIMRVTGHKCESSLRSYDAADNSDQQKRKISAIMRGPGPSTSYDPIPVDQLTPTQSSSTVQTSAVNEMLRDKIVINGNVQNCTFNFHV